MRKFYLIWLLIFIILPLNSTFAETLNQPDDVFTRVKESILDGTTADKGVYVSSQPLPAGTELRTWRGHVATSPGDAWFVFIDDQPGANWSHACRYVFIDTITEEVKVLHRQRPPEMISEMIRYTGPDASSNGNNRRSRFTAPKIRHGRSPEHLYAVILSGGASSYSNYPRYWNDCSEIYKTLVDQYEYLDENIIVAISDGTNPAADQSDGGNSDPDLDGDGDDDIMYPCTNASLTTIFGDLATTMTSLDTLFIFTTDHGSGSGTPGTDTSMNLWNGEEIWDYEFAALLEPINCREIIITLEPCYSGGFVNDVIDMDSTVPRVISTAANDHESSWAMPPDYVYDTYVFHWTAAVRGFDAYGNPVDADTNNDGEVTMDEAYIYAEAADQDNEHPLYAEWPAGYGSTVTLAGSGASPEGEISLERDFFNCADTIGIVVEDLDLDGQGSVVITIYSNTESLGEMVTLTETETAHFEGIIDTSTGTTSPDGILQVTEGDQIEAKYEDADYGGAGPQTVTANAVVDCTPPVISNVTINAITYESAVITWTTDEPASSIVEYGIDVTLGNTVEDTERSTSHSITLTNLDDCTYYFFQVISKDTAMNETIDNNDGLFFTFLTWELILFLDENMDTDPDWTMESLWGYGQPTGGGGDHGSPDPDSGYTGTNICGYNLNGDYQNNISSPYYLTTAPVDCSTASSVILQFWCWLGVESPSFDHAYLEVSDDGGSSWSQLWTNSSEIEGGEWELWEFDISSEASGQSNVMIRWGMGSTDGSWQYAGWNIDDVRILASVPCNLYTPTPIPPTLTPTETPIPTATMTPIPSNTPVPTYTPIPTSTPIPTNTPLPTSTFTAAPTNTPEPTSTPTIIPGHRDLFLYMEDKDLEAGDLFKLSMYVENTYPDSYDADIYILLGVYGYYWCWPSWISTDIGLDHSIRNVPGDVGIHENILEFDWPDNVGSADGLEFIGCIFNPGTWTMIGTLEHIEWGYR